MPLGKVFCEWYWDWVEWSVKAVLSGPAIAKDYWEIIDCIRKDQELDFQRFVTEKVFKDADK